MTSRWTHSLAPGLLLLAIAATLSSACAARADRDEVPNSSVDQFARQLESLDDRIAHLEERSGSLAEARAAALLRRRADVERRLEALDREAPTFAADRQLLEEDLFQLETDVATLQHELMAPLRTAEARTGGRVLPAATGG